MKYFKTQIMKIYLTFYAVALGVFAHLTPVLFFRQKALDSAFCHHNRHLMGHFEFLHDLRMICLPSNTSEKLH